MILTIIFFRGVGSTTNQIGFHRSLVVSRSGCWSVGGPWLGGNYLVAEDRIIPRLYLDVSKNRGGPPKLWILIGFSIIYKPSILVVFLLFLGSTHPVDKPNLYIVVLRLTLQKAHCLINRQVGISMWVCVFAITGVKRREPQPKRFQRCLSNISDFQVP